VWPLFQEVLTTRTPAASLLAGCFSPHGRHEQMKTYEANVRAELMADDRSAGRNAHGWFTTTADNHTKHEVCAQDKTIIATVMAAGGFPPSSPRWDEVPCDMLHQELPANCPANVEPGYSAPMPDSQVGFNLVGVGGACRDAVGKYPAWGATRADNTACVTTCRASADCNAYMSTGWAGGPPPSGNENNYCQFFCYNGRSALCPEAGNGGGKLVTVDHSDPLRVCWTKTMTRHL